ncbi:MAG: YbaY family lipoprotein [Candidatus Promineifilaceae bacterium]|nr:YbaY family lipoprotein [Candidatus Promineifilaceae bacterium]
MYKLIIILILLLGLLLTGCGSADGGMQRIDGQIVWEDGGTLPAGSTVSVQVVNASLADATETLVQTTFEAEGSPPIDFFVEYDPSQVDERMNYSVTVRIVDPDGQLLYITMTAQYIIEQGQVNNDITVLVEPV